MNNKELLGFELPPEIIARVEALNEKIDKNKDKIKVLLLGPGYPKDQLELRKDIASILNKKGYSVIVMEAIPEWKGITIGEKFKDILNELCPDLFICIFSKEGYPHGVIFEIGFLCGHFGRDKVVESLRFCIESGVDKRELLTIYVIEIISEAKTYDYYDKNNLIEIIEGIIKNEIVKKF